MNDDSIKVIIFMIAFTALLVIVLGGIPAYIMFSVKRKKHRRILENSFTAAGTITRLENISDPENIAYRVYYSYYDQSGTLQEKRFRTNKVKNLSKGDSLTVYYNSDSSVTDYEIEENRSALKKLPISLAVIIGLCYTVYLIGYIYVVYKQK